MKFQFECTMCGTCCRCYTVLATIYDLARIRRETGLPFREFVSFYPVGAVSDAPDDLYLHTRKGKFLPGLKRVDGGCVFLQEGRCSIHPFKPNVCRLFPLDLKWDEEGEFSAELVRYPVVNARYDAGFTDFGDVEQIYTNYCYEYDYHRECIADWNSLPDRLVSPGQFLDWLEEIIADGSWDPGDH